MPYSASLNPTQHLNLTITLLFKSSKKEFEAKVVVNSEHWTLICSVT